MARGCQRTAHRVFSLLQDVLLGHTVLGQQRNYRQCVKECSSRRHKCSSKKIFLIVGAVVCRN